METATLQAPKSGKSRFSKALPTPPSFLKALKGLPSSPQSSKFNLAPARKPLPALSGIPPVLPPKEHNPRPASPPKTTQKPLESPLPPVPLNSTKPSAPLPSIPRRPVAADSPAFPSDDSPLSSLFSDYTDSNRSSDSTHLSHDTATSVSSAHESFQASPELDSSRFPATAAAGTPKPDELFFAHSSSQLMKENGSHNQERSGQTQQTAGNNTKDLPLLPPTDLAIQTQSQLTLSAPKPSPETARPQAPQSQPQIWRRRSLTAEKNLTVTELKLVSSNGSTTLTSSIPAPEAPPKQPSPTLLQPQDSKTTSGAAAPARSPLTPTPNAAFPGRNIRPAPSRQQLSEDGPDSMGQEVSRVKNTLRKADGSQIPGAAGPRNTPSPPLRTSPPSAAPHSKSTSISSPVRLPTPEYNADDCKGAIVETILSPVSPASSPELPIEPRPRAVQETKDGMSVKNSGSSGPSQTWSIQESLYGLAPKPLPQSLGVRSPAGLPPSPAAGRTGAAQPQSPFPARTTSKAPASSPGASESSLRGEQKPSPISAPLQKVRTVSDVGSIETIRAPRQEQFLPVLATQQPKEESHQDDTTDHPGAQRFPRAWGPRIPKDNVFQPPPISERHHQCMMRHRIMHETRNTYYPLACQACSLKDLSWRYVCSCCNLRVCKSCRTRLRKHNGDLRALMDHNGTVIVEQSTELEFDHEEAAIQSGKATAAKQKTSSQTSLFGWH